MEFGLKVILSALVIAGASELGKRSTFWGAILISLPLSSILALSWLWLDTRDSARVGAMSVDIFWAVLPSLVFFLILPALLRMGVHFGWSMLISCLAMAGGYAIYARIADRLT